MEMRQITLLQALREALDEEMARDETVYLIGEDISRGSATTSTAPVNLYGSAVTAGLHLKYGMERVRNAPICEPTIMGSCIGAAIGGMRPIADIVFAGYMLLAMDEVSIAAKWRFIHGGHLSLPIVFLLPASTYMGFGADHCQTPLAAVWHQPGMKVALPSTPYDAKGLLKTAIRDNNPVCFFEPVLLYESTGMVPEEEYTIPFGVADVKKEGHDVTVVAMASMVMWALEAAEDMEGRGISVEVVDPRTIEPLDIDTIVNSVRKTGRVVIVAEENTRCSVSAEMAMQITERAFDSLKAPIQRVGGANLPVPFGPLAEHVLPHKEDIVTAIDTVIG